MELKEQIKKELLENKEQERLKKVEANSKLDKIILLDNGTPYGENIKKHLDQEGIQYDLKTLKDHPDDINKASTITNLGMFPMVYLKDIYLVNEEINKTFNGDDIDWDQYDDISYDPYLPPPTREDFTTALYSDPALMGGGFDYSKSPIVSQIHSQNIGGSSRSIDDLMEYIKKQN